MKNNFGKTILLSSIILFVCITSSLNLVKSLKDLKIQLVELWSKQNTKDIYKNSKYDTARKVKYLNNLEKDVILELNKVRTNPPQYAKIQLKKLRSYYQG